MCKCVFIALAHDGGSKTTAATVFFPISNALNAPGHCSALPFHVYVCVYIRVVFFTVIRVVILPPDATAHFAAGLPYSPHARNSHTRSTNDALHNKLITLNVVAAVTTHRCCCCDIISRPLISSCRAVNRRRATAVRKNNTATFICVGLFCFSDTRAAATGRDETRWRFCADSFVLEQQKPLLQMLQ